MKKREPVGKWTTLGHLGHQPIELAETSQEGTQKAQPGPEGGAGGECAGKPTPRAERVLRHYAISTFGNRADITETSDGGYLLTWKCGGSGVTLKIAATDYKPPRLGPDTDASTVRDTLELTTFLGGASKLMSHPTPEDVRRAVGALFGEGTW